MKHRAYWEPEGFHQLGEGGYVGILAKDVIERLKEASGTQSMMELSSWLEVRQSCLSDAKRHNIIPIRWLLMLSSKQSAYRPDWVLSGQGEKFVDKEGAK